MTMKVSNDYAVAFGELYERTPKAVFAAVAFSLSLRNVDEQGPDEAVEHFLYEWRVLHENGIVKQKPPTQKERKNASL